MSQFAVEAGVLVRVFILPIFGWNAFVWTEERRGGLEKIQLLSTILGMVGRGLGGQGAGKRRMSLFLPTHFGDTSGGEGDGAEAGDL